MRISRFVKAILYLVLTVLLLLATTLFQTAMHNADALEEHYFRSSSFVFLAALVLAGVGVYSALSYTRRHREHMADSLLFMAVGGALLVVAVFTVIQYGGLEGTFTESAYTTVNINVVTLSVLPLPFLVRAIVLACSTREDSRARRIGVQAACAAVTAAVVVLAAAGCTMRMVRYVEPLTEASLTDEPYGDDTDVAQ